MTNPSKLEQVARAICQSKTCEGAWCCQWPANAGRRHDCPVSNGNYDDAARAAIAAMEVPTEEMVEAGVASQNVWGIGMTEVTEIYAAAIRAALKEEKE